VSQSTNERDVLARTLWAEARGEGRHGMQAVANVIMRRVAFPRWWGRDVIGVCQAPWQFSSWNPDDVNRAKLLAVTESDPQFRVALELAELALAGELNDLTNSADHFHTHAVSPAWSVGVEPVAVLGNHRFFRLST